MNSQVIKHHTERGIMFDPELYEKVSKSWIQSALYRAAISSKDKVEDSYELDLSEKIISRIHDSSKNVQ